MDNAPEVVELASRPVMCIPVALPWIAVRGLG